MDKNNNKRILRMKVKQLKISFEDRGQDLLEWVVEIIGDGTFAKILHSKPCQSGIWRNRVVWMDSIEVGSKPILNSGRNLKYKIIKIIEHEKDEDAIIKEYLE